MPAVRTITARSLRRVDHLDVELAPVGPAERQHLVLVGPNGSGKTTLLEAIVEEAAAAVEGRPHPAKLVDFSGEDDPAVLERERRMAYLGRPVRLGWSREERSLPDDFAAGLLLLAHLEARREIAFAPAPPEGTPPTPLDPEPKRADQRIADRLLPFLASRRAEARLARESGDALRASVHDAWALRVQSGLRLVLGEPSLKLTFVGGAPHLDLPDGRRLAFDALSQGHEAAIQLWAEVMMRVEAARARAARPALDPAGVVVIDTPERGLDPRLQSTILPALVELYPRVQLFVATHSPLVALSLEHALVLDLGRRSAEPALALRRAGVAALVAGMVRADGPTAEEPSPGPGEAEDDRAADPEAPGASPDPGDGALDTAAGSLTGGPRDTIRDGLEPPRRPARLGVSLDGPTRQQKVRERQAGPTDASEVLAGPRASQRARPPIAPRPAPAAPAARRSSRPPPPARLPAKPEAPARDRRHGRTTLEGHGSWGEDPE